MPFVPKRILVGTDFSPQARAAASAAVDLARALGAKVVLAHVAGVSAYVDYDGDLAGLHLDAEFEKDVRAEFQRVGELEADRLRALGGDVDFMLLGGRPAEALYRYAEAQDCQLIVVGCQGRSGLAYFLVGSTAEKLVRHSSVPVLTIRDEKSAGLSSPPSR